MFFYAIFASVLLVALMVQNHQLKKSGTVEVVIDSNAYHSFSLESAPLIGNPDAPVTVVTFMDYSCPGCAGLTSAIYELMAKYPDKIKWSFRHYPHDEHSEKLSLAALAAQRQGMFDTFHQNLFGITSDEASLRQLAEDFGMDPQQFERDMVSDELHQALQTVQIEALQLGVTKTPTLYINGLKIGGTLPKDLQPVFLKIDPSISK